MRKSEGRRGVIRYRERFTKADGKEMDKEREQTDSCSKEGKDIGGS
jgi:hypothetical protein